MRAWWTVGGLLAMAVTFAAWIGGWALVLWLVCKYAIPMIKAAWGSP